MRNFQKYAAALRPGEMFKLTEEPTATIYKCEKLQEVAVLAQPINGQTPQNISPAAMVYTSFNF